MDRLTKVLLSAASFVLLSSAVVYGQNSHARIVRISYLAGTTHINNQNVPLNSPLIEGNVLSTGVASFAEVEFEDGSRLRLGPDTQVTFAELSRSRSGEPITRLDVEGEVELTTGEHVQQQFILSGADKNIMMVRSGRVRVLSTKADPLEVTVWKGEAVVHDPDSGQDVNLAKDETFTLADDRQQYTVIRGNEADQLDRFCKLRDQYLEGEYVTLNQTPAVGSSLLATFGLFATDPCSPYFAFPSLLQSCFNPYFNLYPYPYGYGYGYGGGYYFLPPPPRRRLPPIRPPAPVVAAAARNRNTTGRLTKLADAKHGGASRNSGRDHFSDARRSVPAGPAPHTGHTVSATSGASHGYSGSSSMHSSGVSSSSGFSSHTSSSGASSSSGGGTGRSH